MSEEELYAWLSLRFPQCPQVFLREVAKATADHMAGRQMNIRCSALCMRACERMHAMHACSIREAGRPLAGDAAHS